MRSFSEILCLQTKTSQLYDEIQWYCDQADANSLLLKEEICIATDGSVKGEGASFTWIIYAPK